MRYNLYSVFQEQDGVKLFNPSSLDLSTFNWTNGYYQHVLSKSDILKPYLISYSYYGTVEYEDIILLLNNIEDIFAIPPGTKIYVPTLENLQSFILLNRQ